MKIVRTTLLLQLLLFCSFASAQDEPIAIQPPTEKWGGRQASAQPYPASGGWKKSYRSADDFTPKADSEISEIIWWGGSSDGLHGDHDLIGHIQGFAIEIYDDSGKDGIPGNRICRNVASITDLIPEKTDRQMYGGGDVYKFSAQLHEAIPVKAGRTYWLAVSAYLVKPPKWVWFCSDKHNGKVVDDYNVNGVWGDSPFGGEMDLAFELRPPSKERKKLAARAQPDVRKKVEITDETTKRLTAAFQSEVFAERFAAQTEILRIGDPILPFLETLRTHEDLDVRVRARSIEKMLLGVKGWSGRLAIHMVAEGETFESIASHYGLPEQQLIKVNAYGKSKVATGEMLRIPK